MYSRKRENKYLLWFVAQTEALHNTNVERVDAYPLSSGYMDEAYNIYGESHADGFTMFRASDN